MRTEISIALIILTAALFGGCAAHRHHEASLQHMAADADASVDTESGIEVLDRGRGPRKVLRYQFTPGQRQRIVMDMKMDMSMTSRPGMGRSFESPTIRFQMTQIQESVTREGDLRAVIEVDDIECLDSGGFDTFTRMMFEEKLRQLEGAVVHARVSTRGIFEEQTTDLPAGLSAEAVQFFEQMDEQVTGMTAALPAEALGVGARWREVVEDDSGGFRSTETFVYTLTERDGDRITIEVVADGDAPPQPIVDDELPPGSSAQLTAFSAAGTGTHHIDLGAFLTSGVADVDLHMALQAEDWITGRSSMEMDMHIEAEVWSEVEYGALSMAGGAGHGWGTP